jgi:hypothetical protein
MNPVDPGSLAPSGILDIRDLLDEGGGERLGDYLALSISCDGQNTTVSFTTTHSHPETFAVILPGVAASSLQTLLIESSLISSLDQLF